MKIYDTSKLDLFDLCEIFDSFENGDIWYNRSIDRCDWFVVRDGGKSLYGVNEWLLDHNISTDQKEWTEEQRVLFQLTWS